MKVTVSSRTISIDDELRETIRSRIYLAINRFSSHIDAVTVQIKEIVMAGDESQHLCRLSVRMKRLENFSIESVGATAVTRVAERAARQVQRILDRQRDAMRSS